MTTVGSLATSFVAPYSWSMGDDKSKRGAPDRDRINVHERYEKQYWAEKFGVSQEELEKAVTKVGPMVDDVKKELGK